MARTVDVYFKGHDKDLGLAIKDVKAQLATLKDHSINVAVDVDDAGLAKLKADLDGLRDRRVRISTAVDQAGLSTLRAQLNALRDQRIRVDVDVDRDRLELLRADLAALGNERVHIDVDVDRGTLDALRADLAAIRDRRVRISTAVDQAGLSTLRAQLNALRDQRVRIDVDIDRATLDALRADLAALTDGRVRVDVDVDRGGLDALRADLAALNNETVRVDVDVDSGALNALQAQLAATNGRSVRVDVDVADTTGIDAQLDTLARSRTAHIDVEMRGIGPATAMLAGLSSRTLDVDLRLSNLGAFEAAVAVATRPRHINVSLDLNAADLARLAAVLAGLNALGGAGGAASGIGSIGGAASSAVGPVVMLAAATLGLGAAAGAGPLVLAGALGAVSAAAGAMAVGVTAGVAGAMGALAVMNNPDLKAKMDNTFEGIKGHMTDITNRVAPAMGRMFDALHPAFDALAPSLERIADGSSQIIDKFTNSLPQAAEHVGPMLEKMFGSGIPHMDNMIARMPALTDAFGSFFDSLADPRVVDAADRAFGTLPGMIEGTGDAIAGMAGAFNGLMGWLDSGAIDGFTDGFGKMLDSFTGADWSGAVDGIAALANSFGGVMESFDGQGFANNVANISTALSGLNDGFAAATSGLGSFFDAIGATDATTALAQDLGDIGEEIEIWKNGLAGKGWKTNIELEIEADARLPDDWGDAGIQAAIDSMTNGKVYGVPFEIEPEPTVNAGGIESAFAGLGPVPLPVKPEVEGNPIESLMGPLLGEGFPVPITPVFEAGSFESLLAGLAGSPQEVPVVPIISGEVTPESLLGGLLGGAAVPIPVQPTPAAGVTPESLFGALGPVTVPVTPQASPGSLESLFGVGTTIPVPVEPTLQGSSLEALLAPLLGQKVEVPVEADTSGIADQIHGIASGLTIEVEVTASKGGLDAIKTSQVDPVTVPIAYGPLPPLEIPQPPPVRVDVQTNAGKAAAEINSIPKAIVTAHAVVSNAAAVAAQIDSLNGRDTSSTHTIHITESGGSKRMANGGINVRAFADGGFSKLPSSATIQSPQSNLVQWAEPETGGEAFIPLAAGKRTRSLEIWARTGTLLGAWDRMFDDGASMVEGLIAGMDSQRDELEAAAAQLADDVRSAFAPEVLPRIGVAGAFDMNQTVSVQVEAGTAADPVTVGREIRDYLDAYVSAAGRREAVFSG